MSRLTPIPFHSDEALLAWPRAAKEGLSDARARSCETAEQALHAAASGTPIAVAAKRYGMCRKRLRRLLDHAGEVAPDGLVYGFRICVPWSAYIKQPADPSEAREHPLEGRPHAFRQMLEAHPDIQAAVDGYSHPLPPGRPPRSFERLHKQIVNELKKKGHGAAYPLNQRDRGRRALLRHLRGQRTMQTVRDLATGAAEPTIITQLEDLFALKPYDRFELDAHRIDIEAKIGVSMPNGGEVQRAITSLWLIAMVDVASRAIVAWVLCVRSYGNLELALCMSRALQPWTPRSLTIPGLCYVPGAAMPSGLSATFALRRGILIALDNAKAHYAHPIEEAFFRAHDGVLNYGRAHEPRLRPVIEQLFSRLEKGAFRELPGGFEPATRLGDDKIRISNFSPDEYPLQMHLLEELIEVLITGYNATPHPSLGDLTPLRYLKAHARESEWFTDASDNVACAAEMSSVYVPVIIRGSHKTRDLPHVNYAYVRYRNADLDGGWELIGKKVFAKVYRHDLRTITLYRSPTEPMGTLTAAAPWHYTIHDEVTRKLIFQWSKQGRLELNGAECAIAAYVACLRRLASTSQPAADQLARMQQQHHTSLPRGPQRPIVSTADLQPRGGWVSLDHKKDHR